MNCLIDNDFDYAEYPEFVKVKDVSAKKAHRCCECGREIAPKETYQYVAGSWVGRFLCFKTCGDCVSTRQLFCTHPPYGDLYSALWDEIYESYGGEHIANNLGKLTVAARLKVCGLLEKYWDEHGEEE